MPRVTIVGVNLNETTAWDGEASKLPPGEFQFVVDECVIKPAKAEGKHPQLEFDLTVMAGADTDQCNGQSTKHWVSLSPNAAGRLRNMLDACGVALDAEGGFDTDHFKDTQFIAEVFEQAFDKPNLDTGETITKVNTKIRKERPVAAGFSNGVAVETAEAPTAPAAPAPKAPAAPAAPAAPRAPAAAPAAPAAPARGATTLPARRPPVPPRR